MRKRMRSYTSCAVYTRARSGRASSAARRPSSSAARMRVALAGPTPGTLPRDAAHRRVHQPPQRVVTVFVGEIGQQVGGQLQRRARGNAFALLPARFDEQREQLAGGQRPRPQRAHPLARAVGDWPLLDGVAHGSRAEGSGEHCRESAVRTIPEQNTKVTTACKDRIPRALGVPTLTDGRSRGTFRLAPARPNDTGDAQADGRCQCRPARESQRIPEMPSLPHCRITVWAPACRRPRSAFAALPPGTPCRPASAPRGGWCGAAAGCPPAPRAGGSAG